MLHYGLPYSAIIIDRLTELGYPGINQPTLTACIALDIRCYWLSESGHGGPTLTPDILRRLAELELGVWFDVYFATNENETNAG